MKILYLAPVYFDDMKQRPQQLAECLSKNHEVYYIEPTVSLLRWMLKKGRTFTGRRKKISSSLKVLRLNGCFTLHKSMEILDLCGCNNWSEYLQIRQLAHRCDVIWAGHAGWYTLVRHIKGKPVVYDKMDEEDLLAAPGLLRMTLKRNKEKMAQMADLIITTSRLFYQRNRKTGRVWLVPNAASESFAAVRTQSRMRRTGAGKTAADALVFGYIGTIGGWFDFDVVRYILKLNPKYRVVLAGTNLMPVYRHARVIYLGAVPYEKLPGLVNCFDICLYNFKNNALLHTVNPVKLYEYLAAGKPVLAIDSLETRAFKTHIMRYRNVNDIGAFLRAGIRQPFVSEEEYEQFMEQNLWKQRAAVTEGLLKELTGR